MLLTHSGLTSSGVPDSSYHSLRSSRDDAAVQLLEDSRDVSINLMHLIAWFPIFIAKVPAYLVDLGTSLRCHEY